MIRLLNGLNMGGQLIPAETVLVLAPEMEEKLIAGKSAERVATQAYAVEEQAPVNEKPPEDAQTPGEDADTQPAEEPGAENPETDEVIPEEKPAKKQK